RAADDVVTLFSGGFIASGPTGASRAPTPVWPEGLSLTRNEGAGEVQTPVQGEAARHLRIGDRVLLRPAKAGEPMERVDRMARVAADGAVTVVPTYRGEGCCFG
ncbi:MAG: amino acid deaminase/aldolase, partial [Nocardioides sp.]